MQPTGFKHVLRGPNGLGFDVLQDNVVIGEVWQTLPEGEWGVRTFRDNGEADRFLEIDPSEYLFMTPLDAVALCAVSGTQID